jgi:hypothetical protein
MEPLLDRLTLVERHVARAVQAADADVGASPVLRAVVLEFRRKLDKARTALTSAPTPTDAREAVIEVEQAADSANVAAKADPGAGEATRKAVDVAHKAICLVKFEGHTA